MLETEGRLVVRERISYFSLSSFICVSANGNWSGGDDGGMGMCLSLWNSKATVSFSYTHQANVEKHSSVGGV